jgi:hypothetical protein
MWPTLTASWLESHAWHGSGTAQLNGRGRDTSHDMIRPSILLVKLNAMHSCVDRSADLTSPYLVRLVSLLLTCLLIVGEPPRVYKDQ